MTTHVLVPIDGSDPSWKALDHAIEQYDGATIAILHVVSPTEGLYEGPDGGYFDQGAYERALDRGEELCDRAETRIREQVTETSTTVKTAVETGRPAREILAYADAHDVDHVVIGSHGRSGVSRILLGSVAETVTRRSPVPVTVVR